MYLPNIDYAHSGCENAAYELQSCDLQPAGKNCPTIPDLVCLATFVKSFANINNFYLPGPTSEAWPSQASAAAPAELWLSTTLKLSKRAIYHATEGKNQIDDLYRTFAL